MPTPHIPQTDPVSNSVSDQSAVAYAHAVFARFCVLNLPRRCSTALDNTVNTSAINQSAVTNAQTVLAISCALSCPKRRPTAPANTAKSAHNCLFMLLHNGLYNGLNNFLNQRKVKKFGLRLGRNVFWPAGWLYTVTGRAWST